LPAGIARSIRVLRAHAGTAPAAVEGRHEPRVRGSTPSAAGTRAKSVKGKPGLRRNRAEPLRSPACLEVAQVEACEAELVQPPEGLGGHVLRAQASLS